MPSWLSSCTAAIELGRLWRKPSSFAICAIVLAFPLTSLLVGSLVPRAGYPVGFPLSRHCRTRSSKPCVPVTSPLGLLPAFSSPWRAPTPIMPADSSIHFPHSPFLPVIWHCGGSTIQWPTEPNARRWSKVLRRSLKRFKPGHSAHRHRLSLQARRISFCVIFILSLDAFAALTPAYQRYFLPPRMRPIADSFLPLSPPSKPCGAVWTKP
jgi:hypothetical protein